MRNTKPVTEASELNLRTLATRQRRARCVIWTGWSEPVWACRVGGMAVLGRAGGIALNFLGGFQPGLARFLHHRRGGVMVKIDH